MNWTIVMPVKPARSGKSRLHVPGVERTELARAIALDTIAAAVVVAEVIVVTDDAQVAAATAGIPHARAIPEGEARGLNPAIARGLAVAGEGPRAVLLGDLPALRPDDLGAALALASAHPLAAVADAEGTGTTLVAAARGIPLSPAFGDGSFARHLAQGCVALPVPAASTLRRDVDTAEQLAAAARLGLGPRTAALFASVTTATRGTPLRSR